MFHCLGRFANNFVRMGVAKVMEFHLYLGGELRCELILMTWAGMAFCSQMRF